MPTATIKPKRHPRKTPLRSVRGVLGGSDKSLLTPLLWALWGSSLLLLCIPTPTRAETPPTRRRPTLRKRPILRKPHTRRRSPGVRRRAATPRKTRWKRLQRGVHYTVVTRRVARRPARLHVVRVNPASVTWRVLLAAQHQNKSRSAKAWSKQFGLSVAINLGMFHNDMVSHVGYLRVHRYRNRSRWVKSYKSALLLHPKHKRAAKRRRKSKRLPAATILDLELPPKGRFRKTYHTVIQNLRLLKAHKRRGKNVWSKQRKRWSEAALGLDRKGNILFLFMQRPLPMWRFNRFLLRAKLGILRAMHLEGGILASLSIQTPSLSLHLCGTYETDVDQHTQCPAQQPIPNILGISKP